MMSLSPDNNTLINETFIVDHSIKDRWREWFIDNFISKLSKLPEINEIVFSKVTQQFNPDGISFALQFRVEKSDADIMKRNIELMNLRQQMFTTFEGLIASFITELHVICEHY